MKKQLAIAAFSLLIPFSQAANANDNDSLKKDSIEVVNDTTALTAPVVKSGNGTDAWEASRHERIALHVRQGSGSKMTPEQLARTFANAFVNRDNDGNAINMTDKPIFVTAVHDTRDAERSLISVYIGGKLQVFNDIDSFAPNDLWNGVDAVAERYVALYGEDKIVPPDSVKYVKKQ